MRPWEAEELCVSVNIFQYKSYSRPKYLFSHTCVRIHMYKYISTHLTHTLILVYLYFLYCHALCQGFSLLNMQNMETFDQILVCELDSSCQNLCCVTLGSTGCKSLHKHVSERNSRYICPAKPVSEHFYVYSNKIVAARGAQP